MASLFDKLKARLGGGSAGPSGPDGFPLDPDSALAGEHEIIGRLLAENEKYYNWDMLVLKDFP